VPIRTLEVDARRKVRIGIGSGIVADSDPATEWDECLLKGRFLTDLTPGFGLIETLRCDPAAIAPYPLLELHLDRLTRSATYFGFPLDVAAIRNALLTEAVGLAGLHRVRLLLDGTGKFSIASAPFEPLGDAARPSVVVSALRVSSSDPLRRHKTTVRGMYDAELARATEAGHFDVLFLNERRELAEGARTNVFIDRGDGALTTPPLASGALDGVYRRKLLAEGRAREGRLDVGDVLAARSLYVTNALRGLIRVDLANRDQLA
jgi:para-aminobenzoate synthetase/4-amino-4-deoxychorismate lyase